MATPSQLPLLHQQTLRGLPSLRVNSGTSVFLTSRIQSNWFKARPPHSWFLQESFAIYTALQQLVCKGLFKFNFIFMCLTVWVPYAWSALRGQLSPWNWIVRHFLWMLRTELGSSPSVASALKYWAIITLGPFKGFKKKTHHTMSCFTYNQWVRSHHSCQKDHHFTMPRMLPPRPRTLVLLAMLHGFLTGPSSWSMPLR